MYSKSHITINNILEAARTLFVERNYADVTITDIVTRAEVSKGAMYHHFSSKEDLYIKMMHHFLEQIQTITQATTEHSVGSCRERIRESIRSFLDISEDLQGILRLVRRDINIFMDPVRHDLIRAYQQAVPDQVAAILHDGIASGEIKPIDTRLLARELVALVEVAMHPYSRHVLGKTDSMADFLAGLFFDGVAVHEPVK